MPKTIELCTFPNSDKDYCKTFSVPKEWLIDLLERVDQLHNREGVSLERFLEEYVWDETWFVYLQAKNAGKLLKEETQQ